MDIWTRIHPGRRGHSGFGAAVLMAMLTAALPASALAQDASEAPAAEAEPTGIAFPIMLDGQLLSAETYTGPEWVAQFADGDAANAAYVESTEALVEGAGRTLDDLTVKSALYTPSEGNHAVVAAFRIDDVDAREFVEDAVHLLLGDVVMPELVLRPMGTKWALRVVDAEMPGVYPRTVYLLDDTAWIIEGDEDYVWDALDQLPDPEPVGVTPADSLISEVPLALDDRRRTGLYEATEPLFLPTLEQHLGPWIEPWLLDLYLDAGVSPAEMLGVIAWWGIESVQDSIQVEGYRLPAGAEDMIEQLRYEIFLGGGAEAAAESDLLAGVEQIEQEIAGRTVTTLDYTPVMQHIFSSASGDTVWVVTDHVGETELVEEALATLP